MQLKFYFLAFLVICAAEKNSAQDESDEGPSDSRIAGGHPASIGKYPYQVSIQARKKFVCGGSIYSEKVVITAAHCVSKRLRRYEVVAGSSSRNGADGKRVRVRKIVRHKNFDRKTFDNDVAVLFLRDPLPVDGKTIKAIGFAENEPNPGRRVKVTGWGSTSQGGAPSDQLQVVSVRVLKDANCKKIYGDRITASMFCAGGRRGKRGACQGDVGGPLVSRGKLVGVVSFGKKCGQPSVYANIPYLLPWLKETVAKFSSSRLDIDPPESEEDPSESQVDIPESEVDPPEGGIPPFDPEEGFPDWEADSLELEGDPSESQVDPPESEVDPPESEEGPPDWEVDSLESDVDPPESEVDPPDSEEGPPSWEVDSLESEEDTPESEVDPPESEVDPPESAVDPPESEVDRFIFV